MGPHRSNVASRLPALRHHAESADGGDTRQSRTRTQVSHCKDELCVFVGVLDEDEPPGPSEIEKIPAVHRGPAPGCPGQHLMAKHGRAVHRAPKNTTDEPIPVDHLTNIHQVLRGERRVRTQVVLTRLAELNPATYEGWSSSDLKTALADEGIEIGKSHGHSVVRAEDITQAISQRHDNDDRTSTDRGPTGRTTGHPHHPQATPHPINPPTENPTKSPPTICLQDCKLQVRPGPLHGVGAHPAASRA